MASAEVSNRDEPPQEEEPVPTRRAIHRPVEGQTMQELIRTSAKTTGNTAWAETLQPLAQLESSIASRISSQTMENREGMPHLPYWPTIFAFVPKKLRKGTSRNILIPIKLVA